MNFDIFDFPLQLVLRLSLIQKKKFRLETENKSISISIYTVSPLNRTVMTEHWAAKHPALGNHTHQL